MHSVVIVSAQRTPIGSFLGALSTCTATSLGSTAIRAALDKIALSPELVEEVYVGHVLQAGTGQAPARQAALDAGISVNTPCTAINKVCASGLKAILLAAQSIQLGDRSIVVAAGMESMSLAPHLAPMRNGTKFGSLNLLDAIQIDGLQDAYALKPMGVFADQCAQDHDISREEQDAYALNSYLRAQQAWDKGLFDHEVSPVVVHGPKGQTNTVDRDEEFTKIVPDKMAGLRPAFTSDGSVTAANASTINDGAAALVLMSEQKARELNLKPLAYIRGYADASLAPEQFTIAPSKAIPLAAQKAGITLDQIDLFEINEAFSVVALANNKLLGIDHNKVNTVGGAVALGHPLGCSGARIATTLIHQLINRQERWGAAGICNGGGGASALIIENATL
jgi:acetyl-CoA C-acetyltransferase